MWSWGHGRKGFFALLASDSILKPTSTSQEPLSRFLVDFCRALKTKDWSQRVCCWTVFLSRGALSGSSFKVINMSDGAWQGEILSCCFCFFFWDWPLPKMNILWLTRLQDDTKTSALEFPKTPKNISHPPTLQRFVFYSSKELEGAALRCRCWHSHWVEHRDPKAQRSKHQLQVSTRASKIMALNLFFNQLLLKLLSFAQDVQKKSTLTKTPDFLHHFSVLPFPKTKDLPSAELHRQPSLAWSALGSPSHSRRESPPDTPAKSLEHWDFWIGLEQYTVVMYGGFEVFFFWSVLGRWRR